MLNKVKRIMKQYGARHAIYGIVNWKGEREYADNERNVEYCYSDKEFERYVSYLMNIKGAQQIYAMHAAY